MGLSHTIVTIAPVKRADISSVYPSMANRPNDPQNNIFKPRVKAASKHVDPNQLLYAEDLLRYYNFALDGRPAPTVLQQWAKDYPVEWIHLAIVEALYQGRYKAVSVEQILTMWHRRQQAQPHFDADFAQMIRQRLPKNLKRPEPEQQSPIAALAQEIQANAHLHHEKSAPASANSTLEELTQFVNSRRSRQASVDAVIDHAEAEVEQAVKHAQQQITHEAERSDDGTIQDKQSTQAIGQFTPDTSDSELIAKLRSVSQDADNNAS